MTTFHHQNVNKKKVIETLQGTCFSTPAIWMMRQAGRYLPEYQAKRAEAGGFLDLCYNPDFAIEVTLQPIQRFGFDAAILFSDILVVPHALGQNLWFVTGEGPRLDPIENISQIPTLDETIFHRHLKPVYDTITGLTESLPKETTLIGFAGAPWTVATYMIAGRGGLDQAPARRFAYEDPNGFSKLINTLVEATIAYLDRQIQAGVDCIQLFDSWAGALSPLEYEHWVITPTRKIRKVLKTRYPHIPMIGFPKGSGAQYYNYALHTGVDGIGLDTAVNGQWAVKTLPKHVTTQGNLDPMLMVVGGDALKRGVDRVLTDFANHPHIFNLGHGITPDANPKNVEAVLKQVRG